jgi:23S rRNA pseudouridine955/2504/2580 synthase/23S rRNA pseudouridine1911/1915/1917 synthase
LGLPIACDPLYGPREKAKAKSGVYLSEFKRGWRGDKFDERPLIGRLALHAAGVKLPAGLVTKEELAIEAPPPRDMAALINQMKKAVR